MSGKRESARRTAPEPLPPRSHAPRCRYRRRARLSPVDRPHTFPPSSFSCFVLFFAAPQPWSSHFGSDHGRVELVRNLPIGISSALRAVNHCFALRNPEPDSLWGSPAPLRFGLTSMPNLSSFTQFLSRFEPTKVRPLTPSRSGFCKVVAGGRHDDVQGAFEGGSFHGVETAHEAGAKLREHGVGMDAGDRRVAVAADVDGVATRLQNLVDGRIVAGGAGDGLERIHQ